MISLFSYKKQLLLEISNFCISKILMYITLAHFRDDLIAGILLALN